MSLDFEHSICDSCHLARPVHFAIERFPHPESSFGCDCELADFGKQCEA